MKPWSTALVTALLACGALVGRGVGTALVVIMVGTLATVAALTHDPIVIRSGRSRR